MDRRDHVPNQLQIDHRDGDAIGGARSGHGNRHVGLGTLVQRHRAIPDPIRTGAEHGGIVRPINAAIDDIRVDTRYVQPLDAIAVDEHDLNHRRHLAHQPQHVKAVPLFHAIPPRKLHRPLQLVGDIVEKRGDLSRRGNRLSMQT
jgi:hypothetical protein